MKPTTLNSTDPNLERKISALKKKKKSFVVQDPSGLKTHYEYTGQLNITNGRESDLPATKTK